MFDITQLPVDITAALVALPMRVGLYVSMSDNTGGEESQAQELRALENVITFFVEDTLKSEFAQDVMHMSLERKSEWQGWSQSIDDLPRECGEMIEYLSERVDQRTLLAFKNNLLEIAITVAMAYRENTGVAPSFLDKAKDGLERFWQNLRKDKNPGDKAYASFDSISASERAAINKIADVLAIPYEIR